MKKFSKRLVSCFLSIALVATAVPCEFTKDFFAIVSAESTTITKNASAYEDDYVVDSNIVPDINLLLALNKIIKGSTSGLTFKELKSYSGDIDLSSYSNITNVTGLGYAYNATSFNMSKLTNVKEIPNYEFYECKKATTIQLPPSLTTIGKEAFEECSLLEVCDIPSSVTTIEAQAFYYCSNLKNVDIPEGIAKIGNQAFAYCSSIQSVVIPDGIDAAISSSGEDSANGLGSEVFAYCTSLSNVTIGKGMTTIPAGLFTETKSLTSITIPTNIAYIRDAAFKGSGLQTINLSNLTKLTQIDNYVFAYCNSLYSVKLPNTITRIGISAFRDTMLTNIDFLADCPLLTVIDANAFSHNYLMMDVTIPETVETIGAAAFLDTPLVTRIEVKDFKEGTTEDKVKIIGSEAFKNTVEIADTDLPDMTVILPTANELNENVKIKIGDKAFYGRYNLVSINFPQNIESIGDYAFQKCGKESVKDNQQTVRGIQEIDLSNNNGIILGKGVFADCVYLHTVKLPDTLTEIPDETFLNCSYVFYSSEGDYTGYMNKSYLEDEEWYDGLTNIYMSASVTKFGKSCFEGCRRMELPNGLPKTTEYIDSKAFYGCERVESITFPATLEYIGDYSFADTARTFKTGEMSPKWGLQTVDASLANKIEYFGKYAFRTSAIKKLIFNNDAPLKLVGNYAFYDCQLLTQVNFPISVGKIGNYAFTRCFKLQAVSVSDRTTMAASMCQGVLEVSETNLGNLLYIMSDDTNYYAVKSGTSTIYKFYTNEFMVSIRPYEEEITIAENSQVDLPSYNIDVTAPKSMIKDIKLGDTIYTWDDEKEVFTGIENYKYLYVTQANINNAIDPGKYDSQMTNVAVLGLQLSGISENENIPLIVQESLSFAIANDCPKELVMTPSIQYSINVTKNPCVDIVSGNDTYLAYGSTTKKDIEPTFVAGSTVLGDITDVVKWEVISGSDLITLTPAEDGKTASVVSKNTNYGTATVRVTAGAITKDLYVHISVPSSGISLSNTTQNILLGKNVTMTAKLNYSSSFETESNTYPDKVIFESSDELVATVKDITVSGNTTTFTIESHLPGKATIKAIALCSGRTASCTVTVGATDTKVMLSDASGNEIKDEDKILVRNRAKATMNYSFSDTSVSTGLSYEIADTDIASASVDSTNKTISISGLKHGTTTITIYPSIGNAEQNGVDIQLSVAADISSIKMNKNILSVGATGNTIYQITNTFGESVYSCEPDRLSKITDNTLIFQTENSSLVTIDSLGVVTGVAETGTSSVAVSCTSFSDGVQTASATSTVIVEKATIQTTAERPTTTDSNTSVMPEVPVGVRVEIASESSIYVWADINPNGQLIFVYVDGSNVAAFEGGKYEVTGLSKGTHTIQLRGVLNGSGSELTGPISIEVGEIPTETTTTTEPPTTTKEVTTAEPTTVKETTTAAQTTTEPTTVPVTTKTPATTKVPVTTTVPATTKTPVTTKVTVPRGTVSKVVRSKNSKQAKVTLVKVRGASKYEIAYSTTKKFKKGTVKTKKVTKTSAIIKSLNAKKTYYIKSRVIKVVAKKTYVGSWSKVKTVKVVKK